MRERRGQPRIPLENILYVSVINEGRELRSVLLDICVCGARIGLPPGTVLPPAGSEATFKNTSILAPFLENRTATVMWGLGVQCGLRFVEQIDARPEDIAELLQSEIFY